MLSFVCVLLFLHLKVDKFTLQVNICNYFMEKQVQASAAVVVVGQVYEKTQSQMLALLPTICCFFSVRTIHRSPTTPK